MFAATRVVIAKYVGRVGVTEEAHLYLVCEAVCMAQNWSRNW